ncbi:MAG: integration host factor subunit beta [Myxococcaceae bacterium]
MTKSQLIERIARKAEKVPRREVEAIVNTVFDTMVDALQNEQRIEIRGFGSFAVKVRAPREGRNPKTGQKVEVPRRRAPYFTVGKELRDRLNPAGAQPSAPASTYASSGAPARPEAMTAAPAGDRYTIG